MNSSSYKPLASGRRRHRSFHFTIHVDDLEVSQLIQRLVAPNPAIRYILVFHAGPTEIDQESARVSQTPARVEGYVHFHNEISIKSISFIRRHIHPLAKATPVYNLQQKVDDTLHQLDKDTSLLWDSYGTVPWQGRRTDVEQIRDKAQKQWSDNDILVCHPLAQRYIPYIHRERDAAGCEKNA